MTILEVTELFFFFFFFFSKNKTSRVAAVEALCSKLLVVTEQRNVKKINNSALRVNSGGQTIALEKPCFYGATVVLQDGLMNN